MTTRQLKIPFGPLRNSNLFSNHWLEHRLTLEPEWTECRPFAVRLLGQLAELWRQQKNRVDQYTEPTLEEAFIQPVFKELGWTLLYQPFLRGRKPDYALFLSEQNLDSALSEGRKSPAFWAHAAIVADAKAWTVNLDRPAIINNQREYPPEQIERYIQYSQKDYGILTNGKLWRLYPRDLSAHQPRFNTYYECDLESLLERWTTAGDDRKQRTIDEDEEIVDDFLTFYLLFSPAGFISNETRKPLVQRAVEGSNEYRLGIGEGLKGRVFEALQICIEGFLSHKINNLDPENHLWLCKEQSLILLYRLLFIMYAEDRELLPFHSNRSYRENRSLGRLRDHVATKLDRIEQGTEQDFDQTAQDLWDDLLLLFDLIDRGAKRYGVPAYDGGLFDPEENVFLNDKVLPDWYLARALDHLGRSPDAEHPDAGLFRVDYRDLSIQHLGHVYEGLLELQPHWAQEPMIVIRKINHQKTHEQVIPASQNIPKGYDYTGSRYETGKVFLVTDKGERRATGSYYTPNYIVDYIVSQTLGPLCKEISDKLEQDIKQTESERKNARGRNRQLLNDRLQKLQSDFDNRVLRLKVLDPAMGSGHFLLRACQYLAEEIATNPNTSNPEADQLLADESLLTFWKRRVVEHCLYGVDINTLAVELAKVALWLETAAIGQPLAFLDHHLRCGNSLIGGWVADLGALPGVEPLPLFEQQASSTLPGVIEGFKAIAGKPSDTRDDVKLKAQIYNQTIDKVRKPFVAVADLWCATFFLDKQNQITPDQYSHALKSLGSSNNYRKLLNAQWFKTAIDRAHCPYVSCFHWELEFPDVFFDLTGRRPEAGFDVVIGNPPYVSFYSKQSHGDKYLATLVDYWRRGYAFIEDKTKLGRYNSLMFFLEKCMHLLRSNGFMQMIIDTNFYSNPSMPIRKYLLNNYQFVEIVTDFSAFTDVGSSQVIILLKKHSLKDSIIWKTIAAERFIQIGSEKQDEYCTGSFELYPPKAKTEKAFVEKMRVYPSFADLLGKPQIRTCITFTGQKDKFILREPTKTNHYPLIEGSKGIRVSYCPPIHTAFVNYDLDLRDRLNEKYRKLAEKQGKRTPMVIGLGDIDAFHSPKIFLRLSDIRLTATYSEKLFCADLSLYIITLPNKETNWKGYSLKYFLGLIDSSLYTAFARLTGIIRNLTTGTPQIRIKDVRLLPIRVIDFNNPDEKAMHDKIVKLVDRMLDLHRQLAAAKIPDEKTQIQSQISATDNQIDQLVYQLYGLTPEEIKIVEESTT